VKKLEDRVEELEDELELLNACTHVELTKETRGKESELVLVIP
jgi:hypothetical protein